MQIKILEIFQDKYGSVLRLEKEVRSYCADANKVVIDGEKYPFQTAHTDDPSLFFKIINVPLKKPIKNKTLVAIKD